MRKLTVLLISVFFAATAMADETVVPFQFENSSSNPFVKADQFAFQMEKIGEPAWHGLSRMAKDERENSQISIEYGSNVSMEAIQLINNIQQLWNSGRYEDALSLFSELENITDIYELSISNEWKTPIPTADDQLWGPDVRIGNRVNIYDNEFDIHRVTNHLFAILMYPSGGNYYWSVNISSNSGISWVETYTWWAGYYIPDMSASIVGDYCYVGYIGGTYSEDARLRRFNTSDGSSALFPEGSEWISCFGTLSPMKEIKLSSNQDYYNNRLYYVSLLEDGNVGFFWNNPANIDWTEVPTGIWDADRGLDVTSNEGYSDYYTFISYLNEGDSVRAYGGSGSSWTHLKSYYTGSSYTDMTAISAYRDTVICVFDSHNGSNLFVYYMANYSGGSGTWYFGSFDNINTISESPDVTARDGGGQGVVYRYYTTPREERFVWRDYYGSWSTPLSIADNAPWWNQPNIEYIGNNDFGVVYLSWLTPYTQAAYFDRLSRTQHYLDISMVNNGPDPVYSGGQFNITGTIGNTSGYYIFTDVWYGVIYNNTFFEQGHFLNIPLNPGQYINASFWQQVPSYAPTGDYLYISYCGNYAAKTVWDVYWFTFSIIHSDAEGGFQDWKLKGGFFDEVSTTPDDYNLIGSYPNPFNVSTSISYTIPVQSDVKLDIYNVLGQRVETLVDGIQNAGEHVVAWDASAYSSGLYFYKLTAGNKTFTKRMTLLK
ncbi:MAG: T9SS type A sorting domain-containing protein [candidate division Zixibacteria bacterium]|nr:T9SS type A sorting domain-containing protein [candidate division Zixibacteria bacterium]